MKIFEFRSLVNGWQKRSIMEGIIIREIQERNKITRVPIGG